MKCAGAVNSSGKNLCTLTNALAESCYILVIDVLDLSSAESTDLFTTSVTLTKGLLLGLCSRYGSSIVFLIHLINLLKELFPAHIRPLRQAETPGKIRTADRRRLTFPQTSAPRPAVKRMTVRNCREYKLKHCSADLQKDHRPSRQQT